MFFRIELAKYPNIQPILDSKKTVEQYLEFDLVGNWNNLPLHDRKAIYESVTKNTKTRTALMKRLDFITRSAYGMSSIEQLDIKKQLEVLKVDPRRGMMPVNINKHTYLAEPRTF